jgi:hypothetical protein
MGSHGLHSVNDLLVARAPAQVSGKRRPDLFSIRIRVMIEKTFCRHKHPRGTETALHGPMLQKGLLQGMQFLSIRVQPFHRGDIGSAAICSKDQAGINGLAVEKNDASSALSGATAFLCSGESQAQPQHAEKSFMGLDFQADLLSVNPESDSVILQSVLLTSWRPDSRSRVP